MLNLLVSGKGRVAGVRYNHSMRQWRELSQTLVLGLDWRAYDNDIDSDGTQLGNDVTVRPLSLAYSGQVLSTSTLFDFQLTGVQNIPGGPNGSDEDMALQRVGATASYRLLRYNAGYTRAITGDWQLRLRLNGQLTSDALIPGEQFGAGGAYLGARLSRTRGGQRQRRLRQRRDRDPQLVRRRHGDRAMPGRGLRRRRPPDPQQHAAGRTGQSVALQLRRGAAFRRAEERGADRRLRPGSPGRRRALARRPPRPRRLVPELLTSNEERTMKTTIRKPATRLLSTVLSVLLAAGPVSAQTSPTVVNGQATFDRSGNVYTITNTPGAIIQWQGFSVGAGEITRFLQQSASSAVLNRITGQEPSQILGALESNGRVFLINPNGVG